MCTVSFIPKTKGDFILTSNRDESPNRNKIPPNFYDLNNTSLLFFIESAATILEIQ